MPATPETVPVGDSVPKINNEFAVGSDVEFQHQWDHIENFIWIGLIVFLLLSFAGVFGRGPIAKAHIVASDRIMSIKYERFQRFGTPSAIAISIDSSAIRNGAVQLWVSDSLVKPLGNQRVIPQPLRSELEAKGILYTFPAHGSPVSIEFETQPTAVGPSDLKMVIPGHPSMNLHVLVYP